MPFSIVMNGYPQHDVPVPQIQGPALQGMLLHLIEEADPDTARRLHDDKRFRPYTLSPLGIGEPTPAPSQEGKTIDNSQLSINNYQLESPPQGGNSGERRKHRKNPLLGGGRGGFQGFRMPREQRVRAGSPCYVRITLLDDALFPTFSRYFLSRAEPTYRLGTTQFVVTDVQATSESEASWSRYCSYAELIEKAERTSRRIKLRFLTPTTFKRADMDLPLPLPQLVFQSYLNRFREFFPSCEFLPDFPDLVDRFTGITSQKNVRTDTLKTNKTTLTGFVGDVGFVINKKAPPELVYQMNLLADFAFFCGTGRKTTVGMGQTVRIF